MVLTWAVQVFTLAAVGIYTYLTYRLLSSQTHQRFENTFFQLLRFHHDIVNAIRVRVPPGALGTGIPQEVEGRPAFTVLYERLIGKYDQLRNQHPEAATGHLAREAYDQFFGEYQDLVGHYFRNLYRVIKFIDGSEEGVEDKNFYAHLVRAQMSSHELLLLLYNGYSRFGKDKFYPLINKYSLLENMPEDEVISRRLSLLGDDTELYLPKAFGR